MASVGHGSQALHKAAIDHICGIVGADDMYMERKLQKLALIPTSDFVWRILKQFSGTGQSRQAYRFFNWAKHQPSYDPTTTEFELMLKILGLACDWDAMWRIMDEMRRRRLKLSPETFSTIIESYGKARHVNRAVEVFNRMKKDFNCEQTTAVYNALLRALCEARNFEGGYALIRRMIRKGSNPDRETYTILVNAWCREGKVAEAQEFLDEMSRLGHNPTVRGREILINGLLATGNLERARELLRQMTVEGFVPNLETFNSLLEASAGEMDVCSELFRVSAKLGFVPDSNTYRIMIRGSCRGGRVDEGLKILHDSMEEGHKPFPGLYAPIVKALCKRGQFAEAHSLFNDMKKKGHSPNRPVYTMLIRLYCRAGRYVEAAGFLVEMSEMNLVPRPQNFDMVTKGLKKLGKHYLADKIDQLELSIYGI